MPKHGFLTPKAISNRIKAKGLQKLRWYCEMCQKQCRDENGFKCHQTSEGHLRQMRIFAENPEAVMKEYSEQFEEEFLEVLSRRHGTKRIRASLVYNEFIAHKTHTHMNSTQWETLTSFVLYLGKSGKCVVDETEKGWYIQWVDRDPRLLARQEAAARREKSDLDDEEMQAMQIQEKIRAAQARDQERGGAQQSQGPTELQRQEGEGPVLVKLKLGAGAGAGAGAGTGAGAGAGAGGRSGVKRSRSSSGAPIGVFSAGDEGEGEDSGVAPVSRSKGKGKRSVLEALMEEDRRQKAMKELAAAAAEAEATAKEGRGLRKDYWLCLGIVVKVMNKKVGGGRYYKKKAAVRKVVERYVAEVKMLDSGDRLRVDQDDLETVIPAVGGELVIVNGQGRGCRGKLLSLDTENFCARVQVIDGEEKGTVLGAVEYEDISKALPPET
ncbi:unnamed protein product [Discosporangium mesarthrocarpum]